jgi:hypothetical protein
MGLDWGFLGEMSSRTFQRLSYWAALVRVDRLLASLARGGRVDKGGRQQVNAGSRRMRIMSVQARPVRLPMRSFSDAYSDYLLGQFVLVEIDTDQGKSTVLLD